MSQQLPSSIHQALDYRARLQSNPRYDLSDIYPQTGKRELVLSEAKSEVLEFEVPPRCINLARSKLEFTLQMKTQYREGAQEFVGVKNDVAHINTSALTCVDRIEVFTRSGVRLMDLDRQQLWSRISNTYFIDPDKYSASTENVGASTGYGYRDVGMQNDWFRTQEPSAYKLNGVSASRDQYGLNSSSAKQVVQMTPWQLYFTTTAANANTPEMIFKKKFTIDLGHFRESILAVDKSLFFGGQVLMIKMHMAGYNDFIFAKADSADVVFAPTDSKAPLSNILTTQASVTKPWGEELKGAAEVGFQRTGHEISLQDINLRCAFESNPVIISQIKSKVMSKEGLKLFIPFVYSFEEPRNQQIGKISQIVRLNRGHGLRVQRFAFTTTPTNTDNNVLLRQIASRTHTAQAYQPNAKDGVGGDKNKLIDKSMIKEYYTSLNNRRLQERNLAIKDGQNYFTADSYNYVHPIVEGSLADDINAHLENWCHIDAFDAYNCKKKDHTNIVAGLPLSDDLQYVVNAELDSTSPTINLNTFAVVQRSLQLKADSISIV